MVTLPLAIAACSLSDEPSGGSGAEGDGTVVLVGDSLAEQAAPYLALLLGSTELVPQYFGGSAPCDWLKDDVEIAEGNLVVISFAGNSLTPCMSDGAGGFLQGEAVVERYRDDVTALVDRAHAAGASVLLVGQPVHAASFGDAAVVDGINDVYSDLGDGDDAAFVDAGAAVENPDGTYAQALPCLPDEPECDPSGSNVVRNDDGLHFCPGSPPPGPCAVYASGAYRFAAGIADAVSQG